MIEHSIEQDRLIVGYDKNLLFEFKNYLDKVKEQEGILSTSKLGNEVEDILIETGYLDIIENVTNKEEMTINEQIIEEKDKEV